MNLDQIDEVLQKHEEPRHSLFQLQYFAVGKEPTHQAKLHRCLRELKARKRSIDDFIVGMADVQDDIGLLEIARERVANKITVNSLDTREVQIEIRKLDRKIAALKTSVQDLEQKKQAAEIEAEFFLKTYLSLEEIEPMRPFDDLESNLEIWNAKLTEEINLRLLLNRPVDIELAKTALSLPDSSIVKREFVKILEKTQERVLANKRNMSVELDNDSIRQTAIEGH